MESIFKYIIERCSNGFPNIQVLLLRCLASMVHHSSKILQVIGTNPRNPLAQIPLFPNNLQLQELKKFILTESSVKTPRVSGIPLHVSMIATLQDLINRFICSFD
jgi:hypothetical protein